MDNYNPFQGLIEHHLRIGDTEFYVPPTSISIHRQMKNKRVHMLRARNSLPKESGYFDRIIEFTLFFPDTKSINEELRPLLAQVKKCPFLPVENDYLNNIHKIEAITISGVTVQTTPGFPHTLQAQIQCYAFEPFSYISTNEDKTYDEMINWPLFRWYYERNLNPETGNLFNTYYEPLYYDLENDYKFRIAAMDDLDAMKAWRKEKAQMIKEYMDGQRENFWGREKREEEFNEDLDGLYDKAMFEYDIHYEDWDIPGLILTDFSVGFENTVTSVQLQDDASPTHQYLGSQDTIMVARFTAENDEVIASLESLLNRSTYLIRNYHKEASNGFLEFDHQLARLFGVHNVTIDDVQTNTIEGQPGAYEVTLTMTAYNRMAKKMNEVQWISESAEWDIDKYENQGFWSLLTAALPQNWIPDTTSEDYEHADWYKQFTPLYRWSRFIYDRPAITQLFEGLKVYQEGTKRTAMTIDEDDEKNAIYDESIKQFFRAAEVYPDLELPTYGEVAMAGFDIPNTNDGIFVEPDFFINYEEGTLFHEDLLKGIQGDYKTVIRDNNGGEAVLGAQEVVEVNEVTQKELENNDEEYNTSAEEKQVNYSDVPEELINTRNFNRTSMESLIRENANKVGLNQNLPVAFAKAMDEEMKQFYRLGTNEKQGKVVNHRESAPVMMDENFKFYTNEEDVIDGAYIGIMKVRPMYADNANLLGKNISYNIEMGVNAMSKFYKEVRDMHQSLDYNGNKTYNDQYVYDLFNLSNSRGTFNEEKAIFAGALMLYLGFSKEYKELVTNNKRPPAKVVSLIKKVMDEAMDEHPWPDSRIQAGTVNLPIKDFRQPTGTSSETVGNPTDANLGSFEVGDNKLHHGMMHDMIRYDKRGRLVRAFPTFFLTFIDEGQHIGTVKLSDQYFQYQAVIDVMYNNSRKEASSTLFLEMSNVFGSLDDAEKQMDLTHTSYGEVFKMLTLHGAVAREAERSRHRHPNYYKSIMLRTGTRIHFRMGYGSNAMDMPTIMNGTITSIQNNAESISVIAQDDGIELTNKIRADVNETTDGGFFSSKQEPTEIVDELLTDSQGFFKNLWTALSNKEYEEHSLGLMHLGSQGRPQGWGEAKAFFGGAVTGAMAGGWTLGPVGAIAGGLAGGMFGSMTFGKEAREISEINVNVYQTTGLTNEEHDGWWNKIKDAFGIGKADESGVNINLFDKSVWDVMNICASMGDDHIVAVHPFGFRSTVFSGKTYFPLHYDYVVDNEQILGTAVKPFRQFRIYDSTTSIIDNSIQATEENVRTVAVGVYMNEGEMDTTSPVYVDTNIWPEKQRVVNIDTTSNAQGVRLVQNAPLIGGLLNKPLKWYFDEGVAVKITARGLSDYVRDMYDGYLTVMGDPSVKPYDQMTIFDTYNDIVGPADVKEVTHIMNHSSGFITMIKPDAVVVNSDQRSMTLMMAAQHIAGSAMITQALRKKLKNSKYAGNLPILNALWASTVNSFDRMKKRFNTSRVTQRLSQSLNKNAANIKQAIANRTGTGAKPSDIARWAKNGMLAQLQNLTGVSSQSQLQQVLQNNPNSLLGRASNSKLGRQASQLLAGSPKKIRNTARGIAMGARAVWGGAHVAAGPIGWVALAIETLAVHLVSATVGEFLNRWLFMRQACLIAPLTKGGMEFSAGINGHKGSVVGDSPDFWQKFLTNDISAFMLGFIGVDSAQYSQEYREGQIQTANNQSKQAGPIVDIQSMANNLFQRHRVQPRNVSNGAKLYEDDRKAALEQISMRLSLLESRGERSEHEEEEKTWKDWVDKIGGWFTGLWDRITSFFGGKDDGTVCIPAGDVSTGGKAKNLSKYFDVIGPKIDTEAKKQGLSQYAEIIKAKTMQESGGNYERYPDVMQASESLGKPIGYIKNVDESIQQGVKYFGQMVKKCDGDIKLALQAYNYGGGFIDYAKKHGGRYTTQLAWDFAEYMVKKMGKRISRIDPGYGDSKYVERVLRYYDGALPSGACSNSPLGEVSSVPSILGAAGKKKYRTTTGNELVELGKGPWNIVLVGTRSTSKIRQGTKDALKNALEAYGQGVPVTSAWRKNDPNWHGTGWAVDLDTPNTMRTIGGKMRFPNGKDKNNARKLADCCARAGFRGIWFGDWDIVQELNEKYGKGTATYDPSGHWNHLHLSYPTKNTK